MGKLKGLKHWGRIGRARSSSPPGRSGSVMATLSVNTVAPGPDLSNLPPDPYPQPRILIALDP